MEVIQHKPYKIKCKNKYYVNITFLNYLKKKNHFASNVYEYLDKKYLHFLN